MHGMSTPTRKQDKIPSPDRKNPGSSLYLALTGQHQMKRYRSRGLVIMWKMKPSGQLATHIQTRQQVCLPHQTAQSIHETITLKIEVLTHSIITVPAGYCVKQHRRYSTVMKGMHHDRLEKLPAGTDRTHW